MKTPSWDEIEQFCKYDGWELIRQTDHQFCRKVLPDETVLETHVSFSGQKTMSAGRFMSILRTQLKVSQADFWNTLRTHKPSSRPSQPLPAPVQHEGWVVQVLLLELHMSTDELEKLTPDEAKQRVYDYCSRSMK